MPIKTRDQLNLENNENITSNLQEEITGPILHDELEDIIDSMLTAGDAISGITGASGYSGFSGYSGIQGIPGGSSGIDGANSGRWYFNSIQQAYGFPSSTKFITDNTQISAAIKLSISIFDISVVDYTNWLTAMHDAANTGHVYIQITDTSDTSVFGIYSVNSATNEDTYFNLSLTYVVGTGLYTNMHTYSISWIAEGYIGASGYSGYSGNSTSGYSGYSGAITNIGTGYDTLGADGITYHIYLSGGTWVIQN
jgi:hypothetical protein